MRRLMVIGLDGATFRVLEPLARDGVMPFLGGLMARGAKGILRSTDPPYTGPGWSSFMTGTNPGKHSNYDIERRTMDFRSLEPVGYHTLAGTTIWDVATSAGLRSVLLNLPMSYPPPALNGVVITGALTPPGARGYTYPEHLAKEIDRECGEFPLDISWASYDPDQQGRLLDDLESMMRAHEKVFLWALSRQPWDLATAVLVAPDRIQHGLWHCLGVEDPVASENRATRQRVLELYAMIDRTVQRLFSAAGDDTNVLVVSDHGFGPMRARVDLNNLLAELGFLRFRGQRSLVDSVGKRLHALGLRRHHLASLARPMGLKDDLVASIESGNRLQGAGSITDWAHTQAFSLITNGIFVNLKGREPHGTVSMNDYEATRAVLTERLLEVRDPTSGERVIHRVEPREAVYSGPYFEYAPDLMITEFDERYHFYFFPYSHYTKSFNEPGRASGNHAYDGIIVAQGPDIIPGPVNGARIVDVMPTICALTGLAIPPQVDGQVLESMIRVTETQRPAIDAAIPCHVPPRTLSDEEQQGLEERLRGLGYL